MQVNSEFYIYVAVRETGEVLPFLIRDENTTFELIVQYLQNSDKASTLYYYNGVFQVLDLKARIIDFLTIHQNQFIFWAARYENGAEFPNILKQTEDQILVIVTDFSAPHVFLQSKTDDISTIVDHFRKINPYTDLLKSYKGITEKVEGGDLAGHLPKRTYQIVFTLDYSRSDGVPTRSLNTSPPQLSGGDSKIKPRPNIVQVYTPPRLSPTPMAGPTGITNQGYSYQTRENVRLPSGDIISVPGMVQKGYMATSPTYSPSPPPLEFGTPSPLPITTPTGVVTPYLTNPEMGHVQTLNLSTLRPIQMLDLSSHDKSG